MARTRTSMTAKSLRGTLRSDRLLVNRVPALTRMPQAPAALTADAGAAWTSFGRLAIELGTLTDFDLGLLELLARTWSSVLELERQLAADGLVLVSESGAKKAHPALQALDRARALAHRLLGDLGLSPPGRERISIPPPVERENEFDEF